MSWASSSEKSDMELSDEESPAPSSCSFRASSVAYFWMYSVEEEKERVRPVEVHGSCVSVQRVDGVGVGQQLRQERLKD
ncbi:hypothetical protein F7725_021586, partial [Dissostichus mawsoni]